MNAAWTFRRCLLLSAPALLLGFYLRAMAITATPEALATADTNSYWDCVSRLWSDGKFQIPEKRRWLYPLLLMPAPALPGNSAQAVALAQHALGWCAIAGVGWIAGQLTRWRVFVVPLATLLFAAAPRSLAYEHQIIADSVLTNSFILACAFSLPGAFTHRRLAGTLLLCAVVLALKPHGKPLALPLLVSAAFCAGPPWRWHWGNWLLGALCLFFLGNAGSSRQSGWLLLSSTLPLVPESGEPFPQYRAALAPVIREARALGATYPWQQYRFKKLLSDSDSYDDLTAGKTFAEAGPEWNPLTRRKDEFRVVTAALARSGLRAAPLTSAGFTFTKIARGLADPELNLLANFDPAIFWAEQRVRHEERWAERPKAIALLYEKDRPAFDELVAQRSARSAPSLAANPLLQSVARLRWFSDDRTAQRVSGTWFGALGLLGIGAILLTRWRIATPLLAAAALSLLSSYGIGDAVPRYVYPVEWMLFLFPLLGLAVLLDAALRFKEKLSAFRPSTDV